MAIVENRYTKYNFFYNNSEPIGLYNILFGLIFSFFLYAIYWVYNVNKKLEMVDGDAPSTKRGLFIMIILPFIWGIIHIILNDILLVNNHKLLLLLEMPIEFFVLLVISILSLKYFYDFSLSFGKVTFSDNFIWFNLMAPGFVGIILYGFNFSFGLLLLIFPIVSITLMQNKLNNLLEDYNQRMVSDSFNYGSLGIQR